MLRGLSVTLRLECSLMFLLASTLTMDLVDARKTGQQAKPYQRQS